MPDPSYENQFQATPDGQNYRPDKKTQKPKIHGLHTAVVTAEEFSDGGRPEINADQTGCVRLRFPWDQRDDTNDSSPTSHWVRVSQYWAGAGYGAQYTPRVGHEVLVAYIDGDPDQPVIVGRLYNSQNRPPLDPSGEDKTKSTIKSDSSVDKDPADDSSAHTRGFNEFRFEDKYQGEEIYLHAQRDLNEVVLADHSTSVGNDQSNTVGNDQSNEVMADRSHTVHGIESVDVVGDRFTNFESNESKHVGIDQTNVIDANQSTSVGIDQTTSVGVNQTTSVGADQSTTVGANQTTLVHGWQANAVDSYQSNTVGDYRIHAVNSYELNSIGARRATWVGADETLWVGANRAVTVGGSQNFQTAGDFESKSANAYFIAQGDYQVNSNTAEFYQHASFDADANGCHIHMSAGYLSLDNGAGASISLIGGLIVIRGAAIMNDATALIQLKSGGIIDSTAAAVSLIHAGGVVAATAAVITLNG